MHQCKWMCTVSKHAQGLFSSGCTSPLAGLTVWLTSCSLGWTVESTLPREQENVWVTSPSCTKIQIGACFLTACLASISHDRWWSGASPGWWWVAGESEYLRSDRFWKPPAIPDRLQPPSTPWTHPAQKVKKKKSRRGLFNVNGQTVRECLFTRVDSVESRWSLESNTEPLGP